MKRCSKCKMRKFLTEFSKNRSTGDGLSCQCKKCIKDSYAQRDKTGRSQQIYNAEKQKYNKIKGNYGLSREEYEAMLAQQGNACLVCEAPFGPTRETGACVDHDHACCAGRKSCGACVRGLVCWECNITVGWMEKMSAKSEDYPQKMERYLAR